MSGNRPTHREVTNPQITARYLAEYMSASARRQRSILRDSNINLLHHYLNIRTQKELCHLGMKTKMSTYTKSP